MTNQPRAENEQFEKLRCRVLPSAHEGALEVAARIRTLVESRRAQGKAAVLGLATGSTPVPLYRELIRLHREEGVSFADVVTFNLDEYYPIRREATQSYSRFMREQLFDHIDVPEDSIHIPDGSLDRDGVFAACQAYEEAIAEAGGLDLQILGIGRTGHIGFNEPGSTIESRTRLVTLDQITRVDAAIDFNGEANVPRRAITMGIGTILAAREVILMAWGEAKAAVVARAVEGEITPSLPASFLQKHAAATFYVDPPAARMLTRLREPWLVGSCAWDEATTRRAVASLCHRVSKPVLKLVDADYNDHGLGDLLTEAGPAYNINIQVFNQLQHAITGWPGGKPNADDSRRPERANPFPKKCLVLAPEPSDESVGMGGTLHRLLEQGHDVQVVFLTSGHERVPDEEALRFADFLEEAAVATSAVRGKLLEWAEKSAHFIQAKELGELDPLEVKLLKSLVRRTEAQAAGRVIGLKPSRMRFLDLAFYTEGRPRRYRPGAADIAQVQRVLQEVRPHQIYAAGQGGDPSSVPAICFGLVERAIEAESTADWWRNCYVWLYRTSYEEWELALTDMAVPMSPDQARVKSRAVYQYQSLKTGLPPMPGHDTQFWDMARARGQSTAAAYRSVGLAEYEAIECFRRWPPRDG
jgi:glucosamine-6-phosphate deaminase